MNRVRTTQPTEQIAPQDVPGVRLVLSLWKSVKTTKEIVIPARSTIKVANSDTLIQTRHQIVRSRL